MSKLIFSIVIPTFNSEEYILDTLNSIEYQSYNEIEVIIVDNNSTDKTIKVIKEFINKGVNKKYLLYTEYRQGVSYARNKGIEKVTGSITFFLDSDDLLEKDIVEEIINVYRDTGADIIAGKYKMIDQYKQVLWTYEDSYEKYSNKNEIIRNMLLMKSWIWTSSIAYETNLIKRNKFRYDVNSSYGEDTQFIIKALIYSRKVKYLDRYFALYSKREGSLTNSGEFKNIQCIYTYIKLLNYLKENIDEVEIITLYENVFLPVRISESIMYSVTAKKADNIILIEKFKFEFKKFLKKFDLKCKIGIKKKMKVIFLEMFPKICIFVKSCRIKME